MVIRLLRARQSRTSAKSERLAESKASPRKDSPSLGLPMAPVSGLSDEVRATQGLSAGVFEVKLWAYSSINEVQLFASFIEDKPMAKLSARNFCGQRYEMYIKTSALLWVAFPHHSIPSNSLMAWDKERFKHISYTKFGATASFGGLIWVEIWLGENFPETGSIPLYGMTLWACSKTSDIGWLHMSANVKIICFPESCFGQAFSRNSFF